MFIIVLKSKLFKESIEKNEREILSKKNLKNKRFKVFKVRLRFNQKQIMTI